MTVIPCSGLKITTFDKSKPNNQEEDSDTKQVYFYLFKLLRKCILQMSKPTVEGPLGNPPFEKPSIAKGVTNFVLYKFNHLPPKVEYPWMPSKLIFHNLANLAYKRLI